MTAGFRSIAIALAVVAGGLGAATSASALEVATFNLHEGLGQATPLAPVIGWQEAEVADGDGTAMQKINGLDAQGYRTYWPMGNRRAPRSANAVPISWQRDAFNLVKSGKRITHGGQRDVTPSRWVTYVVLKNRQTKKQFVFVNTHFISKAFTDKPGRRTRWNTHLRILKMKVRQLARFGPVVVVGDFNRPAYSEIPGVTPLVAAPTPPPYDQVYSSVPGDQPQPLGLFGSDHNAWRATIKLP